MEDASPFHAAPAARAEHAARMTEAQVALREGRPARMAEQPRATVREDANVAVQQQLFNADQRSSFGDDDLGRLAAQVAEARRRPRAVEASPATEPVAPPPQPSRPPLARRALADEPDLAEDDALEARVRAMAEAEPGARLVIEDGDTIRNITARELLEEIEGDARFAEEVTSCLGGVL